MNDKTEGKLSKKYIESYVAGHAHSSSFKMSEDVKVALTHFLKYGHNAYVASFSKRAHNLSLYRTYAPLDGGYCIGFERSFLSSISGVKLYDVKYDIDVQRREVEEFLSDFIDDLTSLLKAGKTPKEAAEVLVRGEEFANKRYTSRLADLSIKHKNAQFHTEEEIKLVVNKGHPTDVRVSSRGNVLIPYQKLKLPNISTKVYISLGANTNFDLANIGFQKLTHVAKQQKNTKWSFLIGGASNDYRVL